LEQTAKRISSKTGVPVEEVEMLHVYQDLDNDDEKSASSKVEVAYRNATRSLPDDPQGRDVLTAVRESCTFADIPEPVSGMLRSAMIGIVCEESRFDSNRTSHKKAQGLFQIMPNVATKYNHDHEVPEAEQGSFENLIAIVSDHVKTCYDQITKKLDVHLSYFTHLYFNDNEALMQKYLLLPLIINAYNGGQERIIDMVTWYTDNYPDSLSATEIFDTGVPPSGYDVYFGMVYEAARQQGVKKFGSDSSNYVEKVLGWERAFADYEARAVDSRVARL
jgi:Transglycosylase SLT domain